MKFEEKKRVTDNEGRNWYVFAVNLAKSLQQQQPEIKNSAFLISVIPGEMSIEGRVIDASKVTSRKGIMNFRDSVLANEIGTGRYEPGSNIYDIYNGALLAFPGRAVA